MRRGDDAGAGGWTALVLLLWETASRGGAGEEGGERGAKSGVVVGLVSGGHEVCGAPVGAGVGAVVYRRPRVGGVVVRRCRTGGVPMCEVGRRVGEGVWLGPEHGGVGWPAKGCGVLVVVAVRVCIYRRAPNRGLLAEEVRSRVDRFG